MLNRYVKCYQHFCVIQEETNNEFDSVLIDMAWYLLYCQIVIHYNVCVFVCVYICVCVCVCVYVCGCVSMCVYVLSIIAQALSK